MYSRSLKFVACAAALFAPSMVLAQGLTISDRDPNGQSVKLGETDLVPSIRIDFESTDNTFRTEENEDDSSRVILSPTVNWFAERRLLKLKATYEGSYAFGSEDVSDFDDHLIGFTAEAELSSKHRSLGSISIAREHDDFGVGVLSNATESDPNEVAEITNIELVAVHRYGANSARGNLSGGLRFQSRDFSNQTRITDGRSHLRFEPFAEFGYRVSGDTRLILGGRLSNLDFDNDDNDRLDTTLYTGLNIAPTGKLSGIFRIGTTQSAYSSDSIRSDETSLFADANLLYRPTNFALLSLRLRREVENDRGNLANLESAIETDLTASWDHEWSSRISTRAAIDVEDFNSNCPEPSDVVTTPSFEIEYSLRRWISFGLNASYEQREVSNCTNATVNDSRLQEYERGDFGVFIKGTL